MPCPPCPFLTSKPCACGKNVVNNVRCSQEKVSCGTACGKLLDCGFHHCARVCHGGDCGTCALTCGKPRKLWYLLYSVSIQPKILNVSVVYLRITLVRILAMHLPPARKRARAKQIFYCIAPAGAFNNLQFAGNVTRIPQVAKVPQVSPNSNVLKIVLLRRETLNSQKRSVFLQKCRHERRKASDVPWFIVMS